MGVSMGSRGRGTKDMNRVNTVAKHPARQSDSIGGGGGTYDPGGRINKDRFVGNPMVKEHRGKIDNSGTAAPGINPKRTRYPGTDTREQKR